MPIGLSIKDLALVQKETWNLKLTIPELIDVCDNDFHRVETHLGGRLSLSRLPACLSSRSLPFLQLQLVDVSRRASQGWRCTSLWVYYK